jgi:hypothetical protein
VAAQLVASQVVLSSTGLVVDNKAGSFNSLFKCNEAHSCIAAIRLKLWELCTNSDFGNGQLEFCPY